MGGDGGGWRQKGQGIYSSCSFSASLAAASSSSPSFMATLALPSPHQNQGKKERVTFARP